MLQRLLALIGAVSALFGCTEPTSSIASSRSAILGGGGSGPEDDGVVLIAARVSTDVVHGCSATMVAPNLVLTARHCVSVHTSGSFSCSDAGDLINDGSGAGMISGLQPADIIEVHVGSAPDISLEPAARGVEIFALDTESICRNDIAFVLLDQPVDVPLNAVRMDEPTVLGETMRLVGYGWSEAGFGVRRSRDGARIVAVGESEFWPDGAWAPPRDFAVGWGPCDGDSGGPALSTDDAVTGVCSFRVPTDCTVDGVRNFYTQLAPFASLAREAFAAADAEPWIEGEPPPWEAGGAGGAGGASAGKAGAAGAGTAGAGGAAGAGRASAGQLGAAGAGGASEGAMAGQPGAGGSTGARGGAIGAGGVAGQGAGAGGCAGAASGNNVGSGAGGDVASARVDDGAKDDSGCACGLARSRDGAWWWSWGVISLLALGGARRRAHATRLRLTARRMPAPAGRTRLGRATLRA